MRRSPALAPMTAAALIAGCACAALAQNKPEPMNATKDQANESMDLKVGDPAPALQIEKWVKGEPVTGFEKGRVYIVEFWATWCGPCIRSMPHLTELQKQYGSKGLTIIGVTSRDKKGNSLERVNKMVEDKGDGMGYTVGWDKDRATDKAYMKAADRDGIPCSFVVDQQGKIAYIGHPMYLDLVVEPVLAGKWDTTAGPKMISDVEAKLDSVFSNTDDDPKAALAALSEVDAKYPSVTKDMDSLRYRLMAQTGDAAGAAKFGGKVVDQYIATKNAGGLNEIAWGIVDPESTLKVKDVDLAMRAATEGVKLANDELKGAVLDTLARCYFVKGDRAKAIEIQKQAVEACANGRDDLKEEVEKTLKEYEGSRN